MTSQIPPRSLELVSDDQVGEEWLLVASTPDATSPSSMLVTSQQWLNPSFAESFDDLSWFRFDASPRDSFEQMDAHCLASSTTDSAASTVTNDEQEALSDSHGYTFLEVPMSDFPLEQMDKLPRYYTAALSEDDIQALGRGKKNHNLKKWSTEDLVKYHEARKNLVPLVMPKVDKMNALADIEYDKQYCQRAATDREHSETTTSPQSSISSPNGLPFSPMNSPSSPPFVRNGDIPQHVSLHARAASSGDYFSHRPGYRTATNHRRRVSHLASSSGSPSDSSTRVRSPLAQQVQFQLDPEVTFDSFLVPHKSGKGEILPGAANAKKHKSSKLSKVPSMPILRKRGQLE